MKLPALLVDAELRRKIAVNKVRKAIEDIISYGTQAGLTERSEFEFSVVADYMDQEMEENEDYERISEKEVGGKVGERELSSNYADPV